MSTTAQTLAQPLHIQKRPRPDPAELKARLFDTRKLTLDLVSPLGVEDQAAQANEDASPTKWHLAHVTWFFEAFVLRPYLPGYRIFSEHFNFCFNSYYDAMGERQPRAQRGLLTRPTHVEVRDYRAHVDAALDALFSRGLADEDDVANRIEVGVNHEQQHQELLLTDILSLFALSPLRPAYREGAPPPADGKPQPLAWTEFKGGLQAIGHAEPGFAYDNETPRHSVFLRPFKLANRLVANADWLDFMADGAYRDPTLWLADGWATVTLQGWRAPLYWEERDGRWEQMTLWGMRSLDPAAPVCHVSFYEAEAYARWAGARLPTEFEWEAATTGATVSGNMLDQDVLRPLPAPQREGLAQIFGDVWEWTQSAYAPYPGFRASPGALGEYNGKFMCNQQVLRGGSCATPPGHIRAAYRNFFYPHQRWQFCGLRLADEA